MVDSRVAPHKSAKRIDYQHTEILSSVFSSRFSERLLVKRASYFGRESARCLRWNKKASSPSTVCSVVAESSDWIEILWPARRRTDFTRSVNGNSWLTFLLFFFFSLSLCLSLSFSPVFAHFSWLERRKPISLGRLAFRGESFIGRSGTGNDWIRANAPGSPIQFFEFVSNRKKGPRAIDDISRGFHLFDGIYWTPITNLHLG